MKYAVVKIAGKQYLVSEGQILSVDKIPGQKDEPIKIEEILLAVNDGKVEIGQPTVSGAKVVAIILEQYKGEKIKVSKFKSKVRYRRSCGFRPMLTKIKIIEIVSPSAGGSQ